jgi:hypothetical protein
MAVKDIAATLAVVTRTAATAADMPAAMRMPEMDSVVAADTMVAVSFTVVADSMVEAVASTVAADMAVDAGNPLQ